MKSFKTNKLATAVAVGFGVSAAGMNTAHSDEILFPQLVSSPTVTTIVTVVNDGSQFPFGFTPVNEVLEYEYFFKPDSNLAGCQDFDFLRPTSPNDVITFDASSVFNPPTGVLFEEDSTVVVINGNMGGLRDVPKPARAFLLVNNNSFFPAPNDPGQPDFPGDSLYGEAFILEFGQGAAWGYRAYNAENDGSPIDLDFISRTNQFDFADDEETAGEVLVGATPVAILPFIETGGEFNTRFMVTPVSNFQRQGGLSVGIRLASLDDPFDVMFDRDEQPISGRIDQGVVCVGAVPAASLISGPALVELADGGWSNLITFGGTSNGNAVVFKLEFNQDVPAGTGTFAGQPVPGVFNNAVWLRKGHRESVPFANNDE